MPDEDGDFTIDEYRDLQLFTYFGDVDCMSEWVVTMTRGVPRHLAQLLYLNAVNTASLLRQASGIPADMPTDDLPWHLHFKDAEDVEENGPLVQVVRLVAVALNNDDETLFALVLAMATRDTEDRDDFMQKALSASLRMLHDAMHAADSTPPDGDSVIDVKVYDVDPFSDGGVTGFELG